MEFHLQDQDRWKWVYDKYKWKGYHTSLAFSLFVLDHNVLPSLVYLLAWWKPTKSHRNSITSLAIQFLLSGDGEIEKFNKVSFKSCVLPKDTGSLGHLDISKLVESWQLSGQSKDFNLLIYRPILSKETHRLCLQTKIRWTSFPASQIFLSPATFISKGSILICIIWAS